MKRFAIVALAGIVACALPLAAAGEVRFKKIVVDKTFRSEGVAIGDVNHDGKTDIFAGDVWYAAPDWKMHEIRKVGAYNPKGYSQCFQNFSFDVNGDGWIDSIVVTWPGKECFWYENPKNKAGHWKQRLVAKSAANETSLFADLLGTGRKVLICGVLPQRVMAWFSIPKDVGAPWDQHAVSGPNAPGTQRYSHGLGTGDVNGDGRTDIIVTDGWWEAPEDRTQSPWTFHPVKLGPQCADLHAYDLDGDGDNDIISSSAHNYGMWWHEQVKGEKGIEFHQHEFFKAFSQTHALHLVDINGDGLKDLVTGKRYFAHGGKDPGGKEPALLYWFELKRPAKGKFQFVPHKIDDDSGVGTQFQVTDFDGDGKPDIITSNKKGVYVFLQQ